MLGYHQDGVDPILVGNINFGLSQMEGREHNEDLVAIIAMEVIDGMAAHFRPWKGR